jgi:hypothetical protein
MSSSFQALTHFDCDSFSHIDLGHDIPLLRVEATQPPYGHRYLRGYRCGQNQGTRLSGVLSWPWPRRHYIPIDPLYLSWKAKQFDFRTRFIELAGEVNINMPYFVLDQTIAALNENEKSLKGSKVLGLGVAYKRYIDDLRESPALTILELLRERGAIISYSDPYFAHIGHGRHHDLNMKNTPLENLNQYDAVLIVTDHSNYL